MCEISTRIMHTTDVLLLGNENVNLTLLRFESHASTLASCDIIERTAPLTPVVCEITDASSYLKDGS